MSSLVLGEILALFLNILTPDEKYHIEDCENLQLPIQMHLSEKRKICFKFCYISGIYNKFQMF